MKETTDHTKQRRHEPRRGATAPVALFALACCFSGGLAACSSAPPSTDPSPAAPAPVAPAASTPSASLRPAAGTASIPPGRRAEIEWGRSIPKLPLPRQGCFTSSLGSHALHEEPCGGQPRSPNLGKARRRVLLAGGSVADNTAEASGDYAVVVPAGNFITQSEGSFPAEVGGANETGSGGSNDGSNSYSLQMNTNAFETQACNSSTNFECRGWVQFVYDAAQGQLFIENSLLDYAGSCPSGYPQEYYLGSEHVCFMNSDSISVPKVAPSALSTVSMTVWTAFAPEVVFNTPNPTLNISFQVGSQTYVYSLYDYLGLMGNWTGSEFNVVGQDGGGAATFTSPTTLGVQVLVVPNGETRVAPICATGNTQFTGDTGETNNLGLGSCCPFGGDALGIQFVESNLTIGQIPIVSQCPSLAVDGSTIAQATGSFDGTIQVTSSFTVPAYVAGGLLDSTLDGGLQPHDCQVTPPAPPQDQTVIGTASAPSDLNTPEITFAVPPGSNGQSWTQVISCDIGGPPFYELVESTAPVIPPDVLQIQDAPIVGGTPRVTIPANSYGAIYVGWSGPWVSADGADGAAISWTFNSIATTVIAAQTATGMRLQVSPPIGVSGFLF